MKDFDTTPSDARTIERSWRDSVLDAILRLAARNNTSIVRRQDLLNEELSRIIMETQSSGLTPAQTLSRVLQELRDDRLVEFMGNGQYRVIKGPCDIETVDLSDDEIASAIRQRLLRIGCIDTGTRLAWERRRRGQEVVRRLTLQNYGQCCAVCDVQASNLLVASHIVPWADGPDTRGDLGNIICLCRFHDALFEEGYWSLANDLTVVYGRIPSSRTLEALLPPNLRFSARPVVPPHQRYLAYHRKRHGH